MSRVLFIVWVVKLCVRDNPGFRDVDDVNLRLSKAHTVCAPPVGQYLSLEARAFFVPGETFIHEQSMPNSAKKWLIIRVSINRFSHVANFRCRFCLKI